MKVAYIIPEKMGFAKFNGIKVQAETWAEELKNKNIDVVKINPWEYNDLASFDVIHIFSCFCGLLDLVKYVFSKNKNIVISPIIDSNKNILLYKIASYVSFSKLNLESYYSEIRKCVPYVKTWLVRSQFESSYLSKCYGVPLEKIDNVPLSFRTEQINYYPNKEKFCLHVSLLTDERKNVGRLIDAAIKFKFKLILAGGIRNDHDFKKIKNKIETNNNITYLGRVSDEDLVELYKRAKVFALPSIYEGVGMVAVEAASFGCDIVVTNIGGPKEYYSDMAYNVDPYDIDSIGNSVIKALEDSTNQPRLQKYVIQNFNLSHCVDLLIKTYIK